MEIATETQNPLSSESNHPSELTEQRMFEDLNTFIESKQLDHRNSKKEFRSALEKKYDLEQRSLKFNKHFDYAMKRVIEKLTKLLQTEAPEVEQKQNKTKKRKRQNKEKQRKKRKINFVEDAGNKENKKKQPSKRTLEKLRKLLRVCGLANPKIYNDLKGKTDEEQMKFITKLLHENGIETDALNEKRIKEIGNKFALKRELQELNMGRNTKRNKDQNMNVDEVTLATRRAKRTVKKISYKTQTYDDSDSESEQSQELYKPELDDDDDNDYNY